MIRASEMYKYLLTYFDNMSPYDPHPSYIVKKIRDMGTKVVINLGYIFTNKNTGHTNSLITIFYETPNILQATYYNPYTDNYDTVRIDTSVKSDENLKKLFKITNILTLYTMLLDPYRKGDVYTPLLVKAYEDLGLLPYPALADHSRYYLVIINNNPLIVALDTYENVNYDPIFYRDEKRTIVNDLYVLNLIKDKRGLNTLYNLEPIYKIFDTIVNYKHIPFIMKNIIEDKLTFVQQKNFARNTIGILTWNDQFSPNLVSMASFTNKDVAKIYLNNLEGVLKKCKYKIEKIVLSLNDKEFIIDENTKFDDVYTTLKNINPNSYLLSLTLHMEIDGEKFKFTIAELLKSVSDYEAYDIVKGVAWAYFKIAKAISKYFPKEGEAFLLPIPRYNELLFFIPPNNPELPLYLTLESKEPIVFAIYVFN